MNVVYLQWHILPGKGWVSSGAVTYSKYIKQYYYPRLMTIPIQNFLIYYYCGRDIGSIIVSYLQMTATDNLLSLSQFNRIAAN